MVHKMVVLYGLLLLPCLCASGCIPYIANSPRIPPMAGRLVDVVSNAPIGNASVDVYAVHIDARPTEKLTSRTNPAGAFRMPGKYHAYLTWTFCGPVELVPFPALIRIEVEGFEPAEAKVGDMVELGESRYSEEGFLLLGDIPLQRQVDRPAKPSAESSER